MCEHTGRLEFHLRSTLAWCRARESAGRAALDWPAVTHRRGATEHGTAQMPAASPLDTVQLPCLPLHRQTAPKYPCYRTRIALPRAFFAEARVGGRLPAANHANCPLDWPGHNHDAALLRHHVRGTRRGNKKEGAERTLDHRHLRDVAKRRRVHDVAHGGAHHGLVLLKSKGEARSAFGPSNCVQPARAALRLLPSLPEEQTWLDAAANAAAAAATPAALAAQHRLRCAVASSLRGPFGPFPATARPVPCHCAKFLGVGQRTHREYRRGPGVELAWRLKAAVRQHGSQDPSEGGCGLPAPAERAEDRCGPGLPSCAHCMRAWHCCENLISISYCFDNSWAPGLLPSPSPAPCYRATVPPSRVPEYCKSITSSRG